MQGVRYKARRDGGGIIPRPSPAPTAFVLANRPLPCRTEPLLRFGQAEDVPVVAWGPRGSDVSVRGIAQVVGQHPMTAAVLLANHGLLVFGPDPMATAQPMVASEESGAEDVA